MNSATEPTAPSRRNRSSNTSSQQAPPTYGYHNTFHTHAQLPQASPPSYARANDPKTLRYLQQKAQSEKEHVRNAALPPSYTCTIALSEAMGIKQELSSPFAVAGNRDWGEAFIVLQGTQVKIHRVKYPGILSKNRNLSAGKLLRTYSMQHAEVGIASDFKKSALIPKSPFAHLVPSAARAKLYESDPHLFEPVREHVIRLRLETEQFLLCAPDAESMLSWLESLCAAIDISSPIEDRSEPRYRSLPRRSRRQRVLDSAQLGIGENLENLSSIEAGRRIIAQQEQIIRQLYPHLAATREPGIPTSTPAAELDIEDFDPEDVRFPTSRSAARSSLQDGESEDSQRPVSTRGEDRKNEERIRPTPAQSLRYRRRCAPVLLASSPRVSDVIFTDGKRMRINVKDHSLVEFTSHPPRYDVHNFPKSRRPARIMATRDPAPATATKVIPVPVAVAPSRPGSPVRADTDDSITSISFGEDLAPSASQSADDISSSGPPSPTGTGHVKADATRRLAKMGKSGANEERRERQLCALADVGLLI